MLFFNTPRTGQTSHGQAARARTIKVGDVLSAVVLAGSFLLAAPLAASADSRANNTGTGSYAEGQFLSGTIAGTDLAKLVALDSAEARNDGSSSVEQEKDPLSATALDAINITAPTGVQLNLGSIIDAGALSQYAQAKSNGSSLGASGAVSNSGAIGVGATGDGTGGSLSIDLDSLLNSRFSSVVSDLKLQIEALAAQAKGNTDVVSGSYSLAGLKLSLKSPALANLTEKVNSSLAPVNSSIAALGGPNGRLTSAVNNLLSGINPLLATTGSSAHVTANVTTDLQAAVQPILNGVYSTQGVTLDLNTGAVVVDLEQLLGGSLNSMPAGTEVLSDTVINRILNAITSQVASIADQVKNKVTSALSNAGVNLDVSVDALSGTPGTPAVPGTLAIPAVPGIVCSVLQILQLCTPTAGTPGVPAVPGIPAVLGSVLHSTADVHVHGTVAQIAAGTANQATAAVSLLGGTARAQLGTDQVLGALNGVLQDSLFDNDGAVSQTVAGLNAKLVNPTVTTLLGPADNSLKNLLTGLLSVKLNLKETTLAGGQGMAVANNSLFTETAMRVSVLKDVGSTGLATINLAQASVAPRSTAVIDQGNPGDPGNPGGNPGTPGSGGNPGTPGGGNGTGTGAGNGGVNSVTAASGASSLAYTGVAIGGIIAAILALLAAGGYLAREGYRRNHTIGTPSD